MTITLIKDHPVYKQVMADSFGGIMYNVDNIGKYDSAELLSLWDNMDDGEKSAADGIVKGAMSFLKGE